MTNNECLRGNATRINQFLYHVTPAVNFQAKSWPDSVFCRFCRLKFVSTWFKGNPAFCLLILRSSLNFLPIPRIRGGEESAELPEFSKSWRFPIFLYWSFKITALKRQITNNQCLRGSATTIMRSVSVLLSLDPCFYLSSKKLIWFKFLLFCTLGTSFNSIKR